MFRSPASDPKSCKPAEVIDNRLDDINNGTRGSIKSVTGFSRTIRNIGKIKLAFVNYLTS
ncbi:MAG: hypothetical protein F6K58_32375 [Symploca sp. SIO2E9]|nr:hypothetical protein [Symploca sp. SIO2E9]